MVNKSRTRYEDFEAELLKRPGINKEFTALKPKYDLISSIIERRNQLNISQEQLARTIGMKQPAISRLEKGENSTLGTLIKVTTALGLDISLKVRPDAAHSVKKGRA